MYHVCPWPQGLGREGERERGGGGGGGGMGERGLGRGEGVDFPPSSTGPAKATSMGRDGDMIMPLLWQACLEMKLGRVPNGHVSTLEMPPN